MINIKHIGFKLFVISLTFIFVHGEVNELEFLPEENLLQLLKDEKNVVILLSEKEQCLSKCLKLEQQLLEIREELVEHTECWIVRSHAPQFAKDLGLQTPTTLFMRDNRPLAYGNIGDPDEHLEYFKRNKVSALHNLTDSTFEHETQVGTGATTGDWLVVFTRDDYPDSRKVLPVVEAVGVNLKGIKNAAIVQREHGPITTRRFGINTFPSIILFRLGHMYRYNLGHFDKGVLTAFAKDTFRNAKKEAVPMPKAPFDDFTESVVDWLRDNPWTFLGGVLGVIAAVGFVVLLNMPPPESWAKKNKKKKS